MKWTSFEYHRRPFDFESTWSQRMATYCGTTRHYLHNVGPDLYHEIGSLNWCFPTPLRRPIRDRFSLLRLNFHRLDIIIENNTWGLIALFLWKFVPWLFLAATKQLYERYFLFDCPFVPPFWLCTHHRIIMKFSGVITKDQGTVHAKVQGQRSKDKVTEVTTQLNRFRTVTPIWIHIWWRNDAYNLMLLRRGALLFFKVIRQVSRSHDAKSRRIWPRLGVSPVTPVWNHQWLLNATQSLK